ncbi:sensor histidine kinase [Agromyces sp. SYSU T00194]|uniref:sensor histidine kinase n=1 Tax=Agromyces chitinivorans TaxID=3158560 RepID=UPI0033978111
MTGDASAFAAGAGVATVLVVDDTMIPRATLARGVAHEGHRVIEASDGREALDLLRREPVDMVLLDLVMPEVDGFEVLETMRADAALRDIPVLVVSATEATDDVARAIAMGAIDCLTKPFEPALLRVRLRTALEQTRLRRLEQDYLRQELAMRQQERLAMLGRLSAGLGHELNNPAAAALATSRQLGQALEEADALVPRLVRDARGDALVEAVRDALAAPGASGADTAALETVLDARGFDEGWYVAGDLRAVGMDAARLERVLAIGADLALAVEWLHVRARIRTALEFISNSVGRMAELTASLRRYSYLDQAPQQDVDVRTGLDDTVTILAHKTPEDVQVVRDYGEVPTIHAFGGQLNQVWTNLLDNAVDAVRDGGTVTLRAVPDGAGVRVDVEDDGPGIPAELLGTVFDAFVTTKPPGEGTGLGLNIAHHIVTDVHGGRLTATSSPGRTVFSAWLPPAPRPQAPVA